MGRSALAEHCWFSGPRGRGPRAGGLNSRRPHSPEPGRSLQRLWGPSSSGFRAARRPGPQAASPNPGLRPHMASSSSGFWATRRPWAPGCITQPRPPSSHGLLLRLLGRQAPLGPRLHHPTQASVLTWRPPPCLFPPCVLHQDMRGFRAHAGRLGCPPVEPLSMPAETTICAVPWDGR